MTIDERWIYAVIAIAAGFLVGAVLAALSRRFLGASDRRPALQAIARPTATFLFWLAVVTGLVTAIGFTSPETLEPIPSDVLSWLPGALAAGLILLAGYAGGGALSSAVASGVERAVGTRPAALERTLRWGVMAAAIVLALGNLGVQTTSLQILIAGVVFTIGLSLALITGLGSREVASNIAVGRALRSDLHIGDHLTTATVSGTITAFRPAVVIVDTGSATMVVPFASLLELPFEIRRPDDPSAAD